MNEENHLKLTKKLIELKSIKKSFRPDFYKKPTTVLKNISFSIPKGRFVGLIGPNGAGKTTTIKCLLEFIFPDSGEIIFVDQISFIDFKKTIGYLPERPYFQEFLTGLEFLKLHWDLSKAQNFSKSEDDKNKNFDSRAEEILSLVKLTHARNKQLKDYSKGMLQRIGIAQALIAYPQFLILDEPMSGLDPDGRILIKDILKDLKNTKITVLMSSHLLEDIDELCEDLIIIHDGECLYSGETLTFKKDYKNLQEAYKAFKGQLEVNYNV